MPKRVSLVDVDLFGEADSKTPNRHKHKRHHRKHKKKKPNNELDDGDSDAVDVVNDIPDDSPTLAVSLQPEIGTPPARAAAKLHGPGASSGPSTRSAPSSATSAATAAAAAKRKRGRNNKADSGTSSGEERWLDAIESGKLEQVDDEMKKLKDPKLMTARQRAMYERSTATTTLTSASATTTTTSMGATAASVSAADAADSENIHPESSALDGGGGTSAAEQLFALPSGYKESKVLSAEDIEKALIKSQKRKLLADEKREKNKRKTMERLLKKKDYKANVKANKTRPPPVAVPMISWRSDVNGTTITFPPGVELPLVQQQQQQQPVLQLPEAADRETQTPQPLAGRLPCAICGEPKRYNCSRTHVPLCSFECYKENVAGLKQIMC